MNPKIKKWAAIGGGILLLIMILLFVCRNSIVRGMAERRIAYAKSRYHLSISYKEMKTIGLNGIRIEDLSITPENGDTLLQSRLMEVRLNFFRLLFASVDVRKLKSEGLHLQLIKRDSSSNFDFLYNRVATADYSGLEHAHNYADKVDETLRFLFNILPANADITGMSLFYDDRGHKLNIRVPSLQIVDNRFKTEIDITENDKSSRWFSEGAIMDHARKISAKLYSTPGQKVVLPFLEYRLGAKVAFDSLSFELAEGNFSRDVLAIEGKAGISGLTLFQRRISPEDVLLDNGTIDYKINVGGNFIELDSTTRIQFNKLAFNPYLRGERHDKWRLTASVNKKDFNADDLFSSLPKGLFYNLEGIKTSGQLSYHFLFDVDFALVDSLKFESAMESKDFKILEYGNTDLRRMNGPFTYTAYEYGVPVRSFEVGTGNPNFRPLNEISPLLQMAVMQSEDGAFYYHQGFLIDCMRDAMIEDIKRRRFVRGGSTISMQLVKNVFLNRNKTIARKLEEALIVWLIEGKRLTGKERMYEVYLNIAEWGPRIYGANEAAHYYFNKEASALNINEAIFLASIVPKPKHAVGSFTDSLQLRPDYENYYRIIANRLEKKGLISPEEAAAIRPEVELAGQARIDFSRYFSARDSVSVAAIQSIEEEELEIN